MLINDHKAKVRISFWDVDMKRAVLSLHHGFSNLQHFCTRVTSWCNADVKILFTSLTCFWVMIEKQILENRNLYFYLSIKSLFQHLLYNNFFLFRYTVV